MNKTLHPIKRFIDTQILFKQSYSIRMQNDPSYQSLVQMGISPVMAEASIKKTGSNDISTLLDWISSNEGQEASLEQWLKNSPTSEEKPAPQQGISHLVNPEFNAELQSLGHSKNVSEKALLMNGNNKDKALKWIEEHKYDQDFQQELALVGQQQESNLTKEQIEAKLAELQLKARERREKQERQNALQREKLRMKSGKEMIEAKRQAEQIQMKKKVELDRIQKQRDEKYKKQLLIQMKKQRCLKLGIPFVEQEALQEIKKEAPKLSKTESIYVQLQQVKVGNFAYPERAKTLFQTTVLYLNNILKNPTQAKFRRINTANNAYQNRIVPAFGGPELLLAIGFVPEDTFLVLENPDLNELGEIVKVLQKYSSQY